MALIYVEDNAYEVEDGQNLLAACLSLGFDIPYFCWHPAMHSVGACRQCAVKQFQDEHDARGKIVMSCMTAAADGVRISIKDPEARAFRAAVIELLMLNHPHDCPVCDEGGECHLQDMTVMTGHTRRRYRSDKRTFRNQDLGPFVSHEMNRCIQCYRCVRFYRDYAGGRDLESFSLRNQVYFGRHASGILESEFSGNLVEICPTGVFTDKSLKQHYARKWDLMTAPSVCVHCGLGCNIIPGERYGTLRRIRNRYNGEVNGYFLCDRGRYGYQFVNSPDRLRQPLRRRSRTAVPEPVSVKAALAEIEKIFSGGGGVAGIGSPRAPLEANYALRRLAGPDRFIAGQSDVDLALSRVARQILSESPARSCSISDAAAADAVLVLGEDLSNFAPRLSLALMQSVRRQPLEGLEGIPLWQDAAVRVALQDQRGPLYLATPAPTRLDAVATGAYRDTPSGIARLGFAVANRLDRDAPGPETLGGGADSLAAEIAAALAGAKRPLVISGAGLGSEAVMQAAANVARALAGRGQAAGLCLTLPEANSLGAALIGGGGLSRAVKAIETGEASTVVILENDLYRRAEPLLVERLLEAPRVIVLDHLLNPAVERADMALPAATFAESDGTLVSSEGRAQRFFKVMPPGEGVRESWRWIEAMALAAGALGSPWGTIDNLIRDMAAEIPALAPAAEAAPGEGFRLHGQKVARQPRGYSGRTAMNASANVREPRPPGDPDSPLAFSMEGFQGRPPAALIPRYWSPGWNSVQALNKFQDEVGGPLTGGDPGRRLIDPAAAGGSYSDQLPDPFVRPAGEWLIVPLYHIFGSEELSAFSPPVMELAPAAYVALAPDDAAGLGAAAGSLAEVILPGGSLRLPVRIIDSLPEGTAGLPVYLPGLEGIVSPGVFARIRVMKQGRQELT